MSLIFLRNVFLFSLELLYTPFGSQKKKSITPEKAHAQRRFDDTCVCVFEDFFYVIFWFISVVSKMFRAPGARYPPTEYNSKDGRDTLWGKKKNEIN